MKVLVTGGAGFVGSHVVDRLLDDGHAITIVDDLSTGRRELVNPRAALEVCDIRDPRLGAVMRAAGPEAVVHVAAQAAVSRSVEDPLFDASVNLLGTISVACAAQQVGVRRVVYISTGGAAYGDTDVVPTPEDHPTRATSPYGVSKVAAERYLECWSGLSGVPVMTLRLANVYGPRQNPRGEAGVVAIFAHRLVHGEPCVVNGDGEQTRDYVYVADVADAVARALGRVEVVGVVNVGTGRETTVNDLYRRLAGIARTTVPAQHAPARPGEQRRSALDATRARTLLGWTPATALDDGLARTFADFRDHPGFVNHSATARPGDSTNRDPVHQSTGGRSTGSPDRAFASGGARETAMIDEELRAILVCPACKGDLLFEETRIICPACRKAYPIRDGIPVMLINEAEPWTPPPHRP